MRVSPLLGAMALVMALRRRHRAAEDRETLQRGDARDELVALGEEIQGDALAAGETRGPVG